VRGSRFPESAIGAEIIFFLLCSGCAPHPPAPTREEPNPHLTLALGIAPRPATSLDPTVFTVRVTDAAGKPLSGVRVEVALAMPVMEMGRNAVVMQETRAGTYIGTGRFTMAGDWRATVTASQGGEHAARNFPVQVR